MLVWWFERERNARQFGGSPANGIGSGFWWSAVTMTTVGYGDKAPVSFAGRALALIWMFAGIIMISSFTATIASSLTVTQLEPLVKGPEDLTKVRVGTIAHSTGESYLRDNRIGFQTYKTVFEGVQAILEDKIQALVYDAPPLRYLINQEFKGRLQVLPNTFLRQDWHRPDRGEPVAGECQSCFVAEDLRASMAGHCIQIFRRVSMGHHAEVQVDHGRFTLS